MPIQDRSDPVRLPPGHSLLARLDPVLMRQTAAALASRPGEYGDLFVEEVRHGEVSRRRGRSGPAVVGGWAGVAARRIEPRGGVRHSSAAGVDEATIGALPRRLRGEGAGRRGAPAPEPRSIPCDPHLLDSLAGYLEEVEAETLRALGEGSASSHLDAGVFFSARAQARSQMVAVATSEGDLAEEMRDWSAFSVTLAVEHRGDPALEVAQAGGARGPDRLRALHAPSDIARRLVEAWRETSSAASPPSGETAVILAPGAGGILFHEACGHALEGDRALRDRSALASLVGEVVGPRDLTLVDDPTLDGLPGSRRFDDEGWPTARIVLIEAGRVAGLLLDRATALRAGTAPTGSARRESYRDLPLPRMTNTFVTEATRDPAEIVASVAKGIYVEELGAGRVDTATADFTFRVRRASLVAGGRRVAPLRPCIVSGNGLRALAGIRMIGADLRFDAGAGECGKEGQRARSSVGQPTILIDGLWVRPA
ncbi:MAG TPA: TldD/PmbA family protein [Candidatus Cryosericum sp.]|nr:TldD/PmbA family protein [Candidatus Cryosericum sp.]